MTLRDIKSISLARAVEDWVRKSDGGWFYSRQIDDDLKIIESKDKINRRAILSRLCKDDIIERDPKCDGHYRYIQREAAVIDWQSADPANVIRLKWPFGLENLVNLYAKNIVIGAGEKDACKTALALNIIKLNMNDFDIVYFSSEMGPEEMKLRLSKFDDVELWRFHAFERSSNFADVIWPDAINIIDYLEIHSEFYNVSEQIAAVFDRLNKGIAIIFLQKAAGRDLAKGGQSTEEKARLYLVLSNIYQEGKRAHKLQIRVGKNRAQPEVNPVGKAWEFKLVGGAKFVNIKEVA